MKGIILAAGRGSRLGELTQDRPKCLTELHGKPLLAWQVAALRAGGIDEIAVVCGYRGQMLHAFADHVFENARWAETNMVMSLLAARIWLEKEDCIVAYSDLVYPPLVISSLIASPAPIAVAYDVNWHELWSRRFADPLSDAETFKLDSSGRIVEIGRKTTMLSEVQGQYMGLLRFSPAGWQSVSEFLARLGQDVVDRLDMTSMLRGLIEAGHDVTGAMFNGVWGEIDNVSDVMLYSADARVTKMLDQLATAR